MTVVTADSMAADVRSRIGLREADGDDRCVAASPSNLTGSPDAGCFRREIQSRERGTKTGVFERPWLLSRPPTFPVARPKRSCTALAPNARASRMRSAER